MNLIDLFLIILVVLSLVRGLRLGAAMQVLSFGGFWLGLVIGALLAPTVDKTVSSTTAKLVVSLVVVFGAAAIVGGIGRQLGARAWAGVRRLHLGGADSVVGAVVAAGATLLAAWVVAGMLQNGPWPSLVSEIQGSAILGRVDSALPPTPAVFSRIQQLLDTHGFPQVFANLAPGQTTAPVPPPSQPTVAAAVRAAGASTVKIQAEGCGELLEGSGFVVASGTVVTNAHVIAGTHNITVQDTRGVTHSAQPIWFDPDEDLAVLRTGPLYGPALHINPNFVPTGTQGAVIGYPAGGPFDYEGAVITQRLDAVGRDIYGGGLTSRQVYGLQALIRPGNSGGPLVDSGGNVDGVVFSRSSSDSNVGYALTSPHVYTEVQQAEQASSPVGTGACAE